MLANVFIGKTVEVKKNIILFSPYDITNNDWRHPIRVSEGSKGELTGAECLCCLEDGSLCQGLVVELKDPSSRNVTLPVGSLKFTKN